MDIKNQNNDQAVNQQTQNFTKNTTKRGANHHLIFGLLSLLILAVGIGAVYFWQHQKVNSLDHQIDNMNSAFIKDAALSKDSLEAVVALPNMVVDTANSPTDLIAFLGADNTQCYKAGGNGYFKVTAQATDKFAEMQYGCTAKGSTTPLGASQTHILAKKQGAAWSLISPTNQWQAISGQDIPSCTMVNNSKISKLVTPQCWQGPAFSATVPTVVQVINP